MRHHLLISFVLFLASMFFYCPWASETVDNAPVEQEEIVEPEVLPEPVKTAIIEIQSADWCGPCKKFKASGAIKQLKAAGWEIKYVKGLSKTYPTFRVWVYGKSKTWSGYSSKKGFFDTMNKHVETLKDN